MATGKRVPLETKQALVNRVTAGEDLATVAKSAKVGASTLQKWKRELSGGGPKVRGSKSGDGSRDVLVFLQFGEKAMLDAIRAGKKMSKAENYMMLALNTLRGA